MKIQKTLSIISAALLTGALLLFAGCEKEKTTDNNPSSLADDTTSITNVKWHLTHFVDPVNHTETEPVPASNTNYYWVKMCDGTLHGYGNANEIVATYSISGQQIIIEVLGQTKINPMNHFEKDFFAAIEKVKSFHLDGKNLQLYYDDTKYLQFGRMKE
ncbi:MAG: META domain-containing protein [Bacteroidales bacterium]|nr:META domain-containing protein [Bacteroidales bacterium]